MEKSSSHLVYMLRCKDGSIYTGYTNDLDRRLQLHNAGKAAKYTRGRGPLQLVFTRSFSTKQEAMRFEYRMKKRKKIEKEILINSYLEKGRMASENTK
ncbi:GIY-YIG nuclease family protein [Aquibacillus koreensis]|uniref:GIY-YIG nuclease family protein n=1 Tax=Aquibacillus koreensis TaxID=279446 RepID=A0A9X4AJM5_9BACI|nr:GIY-YIG nuclease family protein [Aquibacillus koreensis]MCT2534330.1 GIY-YIG nuclease family protein [Aquibacillus koreensis]MDC3422407.1 GIY-YIG nuclease family protein [Aquibacillus koreensis]